MKKDTLVDAFHNVSIKHFTLEQIDLTTHFSISAYNTSCSYTSYIYNVYMEVYRFGFVFLL